MDASPASCTLGPIGERPREQDSGLLRQPHREGGITKLYRARWVGRSTARRNRTRFGAPGHLSRVTSALCRR
jgi:hypothetical protein